MNWKELLSWENIQFIGTVCGAIAATAYVSFKTFKTKLDKEFKDRKTDVSKHIKRQSDLDYEIIKEADHLKELLGADRVQIYEFHNGNHYAKKVIIATGSYSFYKNMDINSYDIAKSLGHEIIKPLPALVQLVIEDKICKSWAGVRSDALIKLYQDGKFIREESGEVMLTSYGISGICAMQLSGFIARGIDNRPVEPYRERKSVGSETTLDHNYRLDEEEIVNILDELCLDVSNRIMCLNKLGKTVTLKVKFEDFTQITRSISLEHGINSHEDIRTNIYNLFRNIQCNDLQIRLLHTA